MTTTNTTVSSVITASATSDTALMDFKQFLLSQLANFHGKVTSQDYDLWSDAQQTSLAFTLRSLSKYLEPEEYRALADGWSQRNLTGSGDLVTVAVNTISKRFTPRTTKR